MSHLLGLDGANERLHLFEAELLEEQSFDAAINGCEGVFHTASPLSFTAKSKVSMLLKNFPLYNRSQFPDKSIKKTL